MADAHASTLAHHFADHEQQHEAAEIGMWLFLTTEFMFFGGVFLGYFVYRWTYPAEFVYGSQHMDRVLGTINTTVLLTSSLTMALAVSAARRAARDRLLWLLGATMFLGVVFLGIKAFEYHHKYEEQMIPFAGLPFAYDTAERPGLVAFLNLYFIMTGLHAFHMVIGFGLLTYLFLGAWRGGMLGERSIVVHNIGLYWHFVDLVWVYLFPFFYLVGSALPSPATH